MIIFCLFMGLLYLKTNDDPLIDVLSGTFFEPMFMQFSTGNSLGQNFCIGILVSSIFWFFNIYIPEKKCEKERRIRLDKALKLVLESFDEEVSHHHWDKHYIHCRPLAEQDRVLIIKVRNSLNNKEIFGTSGEKFFYEICHESSQLYYFLSISANELSPKHGELWDSLTRSVRRVADIYPVWLKRREVDGFKVGVDYSNGELRINLMEFLWSLETWLELNK